MVKKTKKKAATAAQEPEDIHFPAVAAKQPAIDPVLDSLFQTSLIGSNVSFQTRRTTQTESQEEQVHSDDTTSSSGASRASEEGSESESLEDAIQTPTEATNATLRSRKRKRADDDVEARYLQRLAEEQRREDARRRRQGEANATTIGSDERSEEEQDSASEETSPDEESKTVQEEYVIPQHESIAGSGKDVELEKANRTVFLSNVSTTAITSKAARNTLIQHLTSFSSDQEKHQTPHKVESLRFRSIAFASAALPKKAAFAKRELMDATTKSANAYVVYTTSIAAREAAKQLNGTVILDRHLRVDSIAHPSPIDHRRCVFVGNLGFVDDESLIRAAADAEDGQPPKKPKAPGDVEEGLWRQFLKAGPVESVRVVRDPKTRVGKGFAYVQFKDETAVEKALAFHDHKFPPLLPRSLRVVRARKQSKFKQAAERGTKTGRRRPEATYEQKPSAEALSLAGRARKLFGRGAAARMAKGGSTLGEAIGRTPESIVFEGHRARRGQDAGTSKSGRKGSGKPSTRSSRRGAAFKAAGRVKSRR